MSVLLIAVEDGANLSRMIPHLAGLDGADELEVILLAECPERLRIAEDRAQAFHSFRRIRADLSTSARARVDGIRAARAPIVAIVEDHAFPASPDWVRRHIAAHRSGHAGVGPRMRSANPATVTSWGNFLVEYAPWMDVPAATEMESIPGHNSSYKRAALAEVDNELADLFESEWVLHQRLRARGHSLLLDPAIEVAHLNPTGLGRAMRLQFMAGRMFAASRSAGWSRARRLGWAAAFPAIAALRSARTIALVLSRPALRREVPLSALPLSAMLFALSALGEGLGYAFGDGGQRSRLAEFEYTRFADLAPGEPIPFG